MLDLEPFRRWLQNFDDDAIVGYPDDPRYCPIARFVRHHWADDAYVTSDTLEYKKDGTWYIGKTPPWASAFVQLVDLQDNEITASKARTLLKQALEAVI